MAEEMDAVEEPRFVPVPLNIVKKVPTTPSAGIVTGGPGTGKTRFLVERATELSLNRGERILVLCATPDAARAFATSLDGFHLHGDVTVSTPRALALRLLARPEAKRFTGRDARLLAPFEEKFLLEDLKTSGLTSHRLREMLCFFYRSMTELGDDDENWLINDEEVGVFTALKTSLAFMRGIVEPELSNLCVNYLRYENPQVAGCRYTHVLVDDYQLLSRASQFLANLLAEKSILVAADPQKTLQVFESYPYAQGLEEFADANVSCERIALKESHTSSAAIGALNSLRMNIDAPELAAAADAQAGRVRFIEASSPEREIAALAAYIAERSTDGEAGDIYIVSPHRVWTRNIERVLESEGIEAETAFDPRDIRYRYGNDAHNRESRFFTALALVADPFDAVAWRSWCGFDDYLAASDGIAALRDAASEKHMTLDGMLDWLSSNPFTTGSQAADKSLGHIRERYRAGIELIALAHELEGTQLLEFIAASLFGQGAKVPALIETLTAPFGDSHCTGSSAQALCGRACERMALPALEGDKSVCIGPMSRLVGIRPRTLAIAGFCNGFLPSRAFFDLTMTSIEDQEKQLQEDTRALRAVIGSSDDEVAFSYFAEIDLVQAEKLDLKIERISLCDGTRKARISRSMFLEEFPIDD